MSLAAVLGLAPMACTLLNTFEAVKPALDASTPSEGGGSEEGADVGRDAEAGTADVASESTAPADGGADTEAGPAPDAGVIVVGGAVAADGGADAGLVSVLTALDPTSGAELPNARETLTVAAVQYDGTRELWYVFESGGSSDFPAPTDPVFLHIRTLDLVSGAWATVQSLKVPTLVSFNLVSVLNERIAYIAYDVTGEGSLGEQLVVVDTSTPANPTVLYTSPLDVQPIGLIGTRSGTGQGGAVNLLVASPCPEAGLCLSVVHVTVPPLDPPAIGVSASLGPYIGSPAYGSYLSGGPEDVIGWSTKLPATTINTYTPLTLTANGTPIAFSSNDGFFKPFAFAECLHQALLIGTNQDLSVYAIPLGSAAGQTARGTTQHSGEGIYFEPFTSTVLAPFSQGDGFQLTAFTLGGTAASPTLAQRQAGWTPPADLRPEMVAVRQPLPLAVCP